MTSRLAILLEFGFHEAKKYIHSGLANKLNEHFEILFFALEKDRKAVEEQFNEYGKVIFIPENMLPHKITILESLARASCEAWMRNQSIPLFHNSRSLPKRKSWDPFLGRSSIKKILVNLAQQKVKEVYRNEFIRNLLSQNEITHVLGVSCTSPFSKTAFVTAQNLQLKTYYLVNSWKDIYVNPFISLRNFTKVFVWSTQMKQDYLQICPYLDSANIHVTGNPSFDPYIDYVPKYSKSFYAEKYNLDVGKIWLYYTMMPPGLWNNEINHVLEMGRQFEETGVPVELLIRRNPNHHKSDFADLNLPSNCTMTEHYTTYDAEKDLIIQTPEGEQEWMDLVYHTDANVSIPSTVTLEFLALGKPIFNPFFSTAGDFPTALEQHFESGFYSSLLVTEDLVFKVEHFDFLKNVISNFSYRKKLKINKKKASNHIIKEINS